MKLLKEAALDSPDKVRGAYYFPQWPAVHKAFNDEASRLELQVLEAKVKEKIAAIQLAVTSKEGLDKAITELDALMQEANDAFSQRANVIQNIK